LRRQPGRRLRCPGLCGTGREVMCPVGLAVETAEHVERSRWVAEQQLVKCVYGAPGGETAFGRGTGKLAQRWWYGRFQRDPVRCEPPLPERRLPQAAHHPVPVRRETERFDLVRRQQLVEIRPARRPEKILVSTAVE